MKASIFKRFATPLLLGSALAVSACGAETDDTVGETDTQMLNSGSAMNEINTIVEVAQENPEFSTLVTAINAAGLGETLSNEGPYTVFAPTNEAFDALPEGTLDTLTQPENQERLKSILTYHVIEGANSAEDLATAISASENNEAELTTVNGATIMATADDAGNIVLTDQAGSTVMVTATGVEASNGVIHVVDGVLMPE